MPRKGKAQLGVSISPVPATSTAGLNISTYWPPIWVRGRGGVAEAEEIIFDDVGPRNQIHRGRLVRDGVHGASGCVRDGNASRNTD